VLKDRWCYYLLVVDDALMHVRYGCACSSSSLFYEGGSAVGAQDVEECDCSW
jgi:hypothetical protein